MGTHGPVCPICESGRLVEERGTNSVDYKGVAEDLIMLSSVCESCGCEQVTARQSRANKRAMIEFKKRVEGLLTGEDVKCLRIKFGISQAEAAQIFGGGPVAFSKYENDDVMQSESMDKLLRTARNVPGAIDYLAQVSGVKLARGTEEVPVSESGSGTWWNAVMERPTNAPRLTLTELYVDEVQNDEQWVMYA